MKYQIVLEAPRRSFDAESQLHSIHRQKLDTRFEPHLALKGGFENAQPETLLQNPR